MAYLTHWAYLLITGLGLSTLFSFSSALLESMQQEQEYDKNYLTGRFDPAKDERCALVPAPYTTRKNLYLHKETIQAYKKLYVAAKAEGLDLKIVSGIRNFYAQKTIWEAKYTGKRTVNNKYVDQKKSPKDKALQVLEWNSMPSTSRHHWGSDLDINSVDPAYFETAKGKKEYAWLKANAHKYGFCQVYSTKGPARPHGYEEEPWHWSYMPLASQLTKAYYQQISDQDIADLGFAGSESALDIGVVSKYVLGISPACEPEIQKWRGY